MWLNGLRPADFQNDQQLEQAWQDQVDQLWTLQLRQRAGIEQSTFEAARARGATYLQKYLLPKGTTHAEVGPQASGHCFCTCPAAQLQASCSEQLITLSHCTVQDIMF